MNEKRPIFDDEIDSKRNNEHCFMEMENDREKHINQHPVKLL